MRELTVFTILFICLMFGSIYFDINHKKVVYINEFSKDTIRDSRDTQPYVWNGTQWVRVPESIALKSEEIAVGQLWQFESRNPFEKPCIWKIIAIKEGWVQYQRYPRPGSYWEEEIEFFVKYHKRVK